MAEGDRLGLESREVTTSSTAEGDRASDRVLVSDGLALLLLSLAPLRRAPVRDGANFPDGGAALLVTEAFRRQGASESWLHDVGIGLKTLARVMIHHQGFDGADDLLPPEKVGWSRCASSVHLVGSAMAFEDSAAAAGVHQGPTLPLTIDVATAIAQELSTESVNRTISILELAYGMAHRIPDGPPHSEASVLYARRVQGRLRSRERRTASQRATQADRPAD